MSNETTTEHAKVTIMIGRNGTARHRALARVTDSAPGTPWNRRTYSRLQMTCGCPGSVNGRAYHGARIIADGWDRADCGHGR
jgi:hypothetical protein